jgi:glutathione S-transferase
MGALRIYGYPVSTWTRTACMVAIEKGIDYELVPIARGSAEHEAMHPFKKMPVVEYDGRLITEGLAITGYLDEAFEGPPLQPADPWQRAQMHRWMSLCADYVFREVVRGLPRSRPATADELAAATEVLQKIDGLIDASPFLLGEEVTLADLYLAPQASNAREKAPELLAPLQRLSSWLAVVEARPSFVRTSYDPAKL